ncbi:hypothetical protein [Kordiimonas aquimaris]|uniref:hypothetical protein n=1 Tax=Kordiimonas aquimaris TaxID=707591 RepID=UPI0021CE357F|nr:hypothetical protein [Kordiimonas aquimaris]
MNKRIIKSLVCASALSVAAPVTADEEKRDSFISYSFIEGAYVHNDFSPNGLVISDSDGVGDTTDDNLGTLFGATGKGGAGRFSVELYNGDSVGLHFVGDYLQTNHDLRIDVVSLAGATASGILATKQEELRFALGLNTMVSDSISVFAELGFVNTKTAFAEADLVLGTGGTVVADVSSASGSRKALDGRVGFRAMVTDHFEFTGYARYNGNGKIVSDGAGGADFSHKIQAGAGGFYHFNNSISLGADYEFAKPGRLRLVARLSF